MRKVIPNKYSILLLLYRITIKMRDDFEIPMIMTYNRTFYNDQSPWILFTKGMQSSKSDLEFDYTKIGLMNRGIVCAYPLVRGNY